MSFNMRGSTLLRTQTIASFLFFLIAHCTQMRSCYTYCYIPCFCLFVCLILCSKSRTSFHANTHIPTACFLREGHVELCHACHFHNLINKSPAVGAPAASTFMLLIASLPRKSELWNSVVSPDGLLSTCTLGEQEAHTLPSQRNNCSQS